jgi:type IV pilus assembly protein PilC
MATEPKNPEKPAGTDEGASALRDALISKVRNDEGPRAPHVTPHEIGAGAPQENSMMARDLSIGGPSYLDRAIFCRQLATLIEIGIPMLKALQMLAARTSNRRLAKAIQDAARGVEEGEPIHQALGRNVRVFSPMVINIIRIGETGGILEDSLVRLAEIMEARAAIKRKVISAMMYPAVALFVAVLVVTVIMVKAIPVFAEVYKTSNAELPTITQLIIALSNFMQSAWWILLILVVLAVWGIRMASHTPGGARIISWLALKVPVFRGISRKLAVARSCKTISGLITAGIPLVDALRISADTNENVIVADALHDVHAHVERGERMATPLAHSGVFPALVVDMISIGEETGTLDRMLNKISEIYDAEVDATMNGLSSILEPVLIVFLGGIVMFIALAVLLPYFNLVHVTEG